MTFDEVFEQEFNRQHNECRKYVGYKPWWMNRDQWEAVACLCILPSEHEGKCDCGNNDHR